MTVTLEDLDKKLDHVLGQQERLADAQEKQNGRLQKLEQWRVDQIVADAREEGRRESTGSIFLTWGMVAKMGTLLGVIGGAMTIVLRFWGN